MHEKFYKKLESLISSEEGGRLLSKSKAKPETLKKIESLINAASELIPGYCTDSNSNKVTQMMGELYDEMVAIFGRGDSDMKLLNKMLRDMITI